MKQLRRFGGEVGWNRPEDMSKDPYHNCIVVGDFYEVRRANEFIFMSILPHMVSREAHI